MSSAVSSPSAWEQALFARTYRNPLSDTLSEFQAALAFVDRLDATADTPSAPFRKSELSAFNIDTLFSRLLSEHILRSQLLDTLRSGKFYNALGGSLPSYGSHSPKKTASCLSNTPEHIPSILESLHSNRNAKYHGSSVVALKQLLQVRIKQCGRWDFKAYLPYNYFAKTLSIIQSSGTGKSRLVDELSKELFTVSFTLRPVGETGYPPSDPEITEFLRRGQGNDEYTNHTQAAALIAGALQQGMSAPSMLYFNESVTKGAERVTPFYGI